LGKKNKNFFKANVVPTAIWHYYTIPMRLMAAAATKAKLNGQCCGQRATGECFQINELAPPTPVWTLDHDLRRILTRPANTHSSKSKKRETRNTGSAKKKLLVKKTYPTVLCPAKILKLYYPYNKMLYFDIRSPILNFIFQFMIVM